MQETRPWDLRVRSFFLSRSRAPCLPRWPITTCISGVTIYHIEHISSAELVILNYHLHYYQQFFSDYDANLPVWRLAPIISHYYCTFQSQQIISVQINQTCLRPNYDTLFGTGQKMVWYLFMHSNNCYSSSKINNHLWPRYVFREQYRRKGAILQECRKHLSSSRKICKLWRSVCSLLSISSRQNYISALVNQFANQLTRMQNRFTSDCQSRIGTKLDRIGMQNQNCFKGCTSRVSIRPMQCVFHWHLAWSEVQWTPIQVQCRANLPQTQQKDSLAIEAQSQGKSGRS